RRGSVGTDSRGSARPAGGRLSRADVCIQVSGVRSLCSAGRKSRRADGRQPDLEAEPLSAGVVGLQAWLPVSDCEAARCMGHLVKGLYERGFGRDEVIKLFRFIDWIMGLPKELERSFRQELHEYEKEKHMPYVTSVERLSREDGEKIGRQKQ